MIPATPETGLDALVAKLAATNEPAARTALLKETLARYPAQHIAERLKDEADRARMRDTALSARWCQDINTLGTLAGDPSVVALGYMVEAALIFVESRHRESLARFDDAAALFRQHGNEIGWA